MANKLYKIGEEKDAEMPSMPLLAIEDGTVWEAENAEDAVSIIIGSGYLELSKEDRWHERVKRARMEVLLGTWRNQNLQVMHSKLGVIKLNYAADEENQLESKELDELYKQEKMNIFIDNDKVFLLSMIKIGMLVIAENSMSTIFIPKNSQMNPEPNKFIVLHEAFDIDELIKKYM